LLGALPVTRKILDEKNLPQSDAADKRENNVGAVQY